MPISPETIERRIYIIHGQKIMIDEDLAELYGVATKALVQAVKRNLNRFPRDFAFQLSYQEVRNLRSQFVTSSVELSEINSVINDGNSSLHGGRRSLPYAFTEQGVAMLASVLNSPRAIGVNIEIVRAFVRLRQLIASNVELARQLSELEKKYDSQFRVVFDAIKQLMLPQVPHKRGKLGFGD